MWVLPRRGNDRFGRICRVRISSFAFVCSLLIPSKSLEILFPDMPAPGNFIEFIDKNADGFIQRLANAVAIPR